MSKNLKELSFRFQRYYYFFKLWNIFDFFCTPDRIRTCNLLLSVPHYVTITNYIVVVSTMLSPCLIDLGGPYIVCTHLWILSNLARHSSTYTIWCVHRISGLPLPDFHQKGSSFFRICSNSVHHFCFSTYMCRVVNHN